MSGVAVNYPEWKEVIKRKAVVGYDAAYAILYRQARELRRLQKLYLAESDLETKKVLFGMIQEYAKEIDEFIETGKKAYEAVNSLAGISSSDW